MITSNDIPTLVQHESSEAGENLADELMVDVGNLKVGGLAITHVGGF